MQLLVDDRARNRGQSRHGRPLGSAIQSLFADAARFTRHSPGDRWFVDETYFNVNGVWRYAYRAIGQHGQIIDVLVGTRRDGGRVEARSPESIRTQAPIDWCRPTAG